MRHQSEHNLLFQSNFREMAKSLSKFLQVPAYEILLHHFPDGESNIRLPQEFSGTTWLLGSIFPPNDSIIELLFTGHGLRKAGVSKVNLITPYLPYMRQDRAFRKGEIVSAEAIGELLSGYVDQIITVDPHLHRIKDLSEIYSCKSVVLHAAQYLAEWIDKHITDPVIVGPDSESQQWVSDIATRLNAPYVVFQKKRTGDMTIEIDSSGIEKIGKGTPVIMDDIISTGTTMAMAGSLIKKHTGKDPTGVAVHGLFVKGARKKLHDAGFLQIITTNTLPTEREQIDLTNLIAGHVIEQIRDLS